MIDPVQLPILLKAIDFVFEEGRKILEERRERRKAKEAQPQSANQEPAKEAVLLEKGAEAKEVPAKEVEAKEITRNELLASKIDELLWKNNEEEIQHLVRLLETYSRNYNLAKEQYAKWGSALVPPIIMHNMTEAENAMVETLQRLEAVLARVYKKDIHLNQ